EIERVENLNWRRGFAYRLRRNPGSTNNDVLDSVAMQSQILHFEEALPSLKDIFISYTSNAANTNANEQTHTEANTKE
ncbi:MAG: DUF4162 domain-containing protein, partial [Muribaculaceae bacterium]|nr:DUF4162 domain-containing protein [Muribaculaceae bacterium]